MCGALQENRLFVTERAPSVPDKALASETGFQSTINHWLDRAITLLSVAMAVFHIVNAQFFLFPPFENQNIHLFFGLVLIFLGMARRQPGRTAWCAYITLAVLAVIATGYIQLQMDQLQVSAGVLRWRDTIIGLLLIVLALEASRTVFGLAVPLLTVIALVYMLYGNLLPGILYHGGFTFQRTVASLTTTFNGIYGGLLNVSATFIVMFMIFGGLLNATGAGQFFMDIAHSIGRRFRAGPAIASVISSGLMGSINGSAVANVATTGVINVPLMKRSGFRPEFAAAVEASASTGGMILPPIMGVSAFVMAELTGIPYATIALGALVPALLYYLLIFVSVMLRANHAGIRASEIGDPHPLCWILCKGWFHVLPLITVIACLFRGYSPTQAGLYGVYAIVGVYACATMIREGPAALFRREFWARLRDGLVEGALNAIVVAAILAAVGVMVQAIISTGLAHRFLFQLLLTADTSWAVLLMTMGAALFFGMGVPTTASYILLASLLAPALVKFGVPLLAAHLFIYYYTVIGNLTPPVGSAAIVAARLADANFLRTCFVSLRLSFVALVIPFMFVFHAELLLQGTALRIIEIILSSALGLISLAAAWEGFILRETSTLERLGLAAGGVLLLAPVSLAVTLVGLGITALAVSVHRLRSGSVAVRGTANDSAVRTKSR